MNMLQILEMPYRLKMALITQQLNGLLENLKN